MELLVSLVIDALFVLVLLGGASHVYLFLLWWHLPGRWSPRQPHWLRLWRWAATLLIQGIALVLFYGNAHPWHLWVVASGIAFATASLFFSIAAAYAYHLAEVERESAK